MSLLFGVVGRVPLPSEVLELKSRLSQNGLWDVTFLPIVDGLSVGVVSPLFPASREAVPNFFANDNIFVAIAGNPTIEGVSLAASDVASIFGSCQMQRLHVAEGSFAIVIYDLANRSVTVFTDALRTTPLQYLSRGSVFAFGPDAKTALLLAAERPRMSRENALLFLVNRYTLGPRTLFAEVNRVCPGEKICFKLDENRLESTKFWDLTFDSTLKSKAEGSKALYDALIHSHKSMLGELASGEQYQLFLTGGLDSKGTLAIVDFLGRKPEKAITWGRCPELPGSDPDIARVLSDAFSVPFEFCQVDGGEWSQHSPLWARMGEVLTDNANSFATPIDYFASRRSDFTKFFVLGDEMFGAGPIPLDVDSAINNIFRTAIRSSDGLLSNVLKHDASREVIRGFNSGIYELVSQCSSSKPKDIQDYLYFHAYISCWILTPGNFKLPVLPVRRPMLTLPVVDCVRSLSPGLRVDKFAYVNMLQRFFPGVSKFPLTTTDAGVDWGMLMRGNSVLQHSIKQLIQPDRLSQLPIADDLDLERIGSFYKSIFDSTESSGQRLRKTKRAIYNLRSLTGKSKVVASIAHKLQPVVMRWLGDERLERSAKRNQLAMRLALLVLMQETLCESG